MTRDQIIDACAQAAHEVNRIYCAARGDTSHAPWNYSPAWQQESARSGVAVALSGVTPAAQHEAWMAEKLKDGWRYGEIKDSARKIHPSLRPFEELPTAQRAKDALFQQVVRSLFDALGPPEAPTTERAIATAEQGTTL